MNRLRCIGALALGLGVSVASFAACGSHDSTAGAAASNAQGSGGAPNGVAVATSVTSVTSGSGGDTNADAGPPGPYAAARVADFALPKLLDFDFCFSADALSPTTTWTGPMLRGTQSFVTEGVISPYVHAPVNTQSIRFVLAQSSDCSATLEGVPDFALDTPLAENSRSTLLFIGAGFDFTDLGFDAGNKPFRVSQLTDVVEPADGGNSLRVVNLVIAQDSLDIYAYSGMGNKLPCTLMYNDVAFGQVGVASSLPGDGGPTAMNGYAPLVGKNLYDLTFATMGLVPHGADCSNPPYGVYTTDGYLGQGAWTIFFYADGSTRLFCRDDGSDNPFCTPY